MERFVKGDIVVLAFPFTNLSTVKRRPAFVLKTAGDDLVVLEITTTYNRNRESVSLDPDDFAEGDIMTCPDCGLDYIIEIDANGLIALKELVLEGEDWGQ